jgi:hypothetical protein
MPNHKLEDRVKVLEEEVARLKIRLESPNKTKEDWLDKVYGAFANDPAFDEAMRLGREWRESFRPKPRKRKKKQK